jgi:hypothetical protein
LLNRLKQKGLKKSKQPRLKEREKRKMLRKRKKERKI